MKDADFICEVRGAQGYRGYKGETRGKEWSADKLGVFSSNTCQHLKVLKELSLRPGTCRQPEGCRWMQSSLKGNVRWLQVAWAQCQKQGGVKFRETSTAKSHRSHCPTAPYRYTVYINIYWNSFYPLWEIIARQLQFRVDDVIKSSLWWRS